MADGGVAYSDHASAETDTTDKDHKTHHEAHSGGTTSTGGGADSGGGSGVGSPHADVECKGSSSPSA